MVEMYAPCWVGSKSIFTPAFFILIMSGRNDVSVKLASRSYTQSYPRLLVRLWKVCSAVIAVAAELEPMTPTALMSAGYLLLSHLNGPSTSPPVTSGMAE